jgi:TonB-dependent SusC/RagA subfamily outer membrane receptor
VQIFILGTRLGTLTNSAGQFILVNVPVGEADVRAQLIGHGTAGRVVNVISGEVAVINLELQVSAIALDEIVVSGAGIATEKRKLGNTIATIGAASIEDKAINSFSEILQGREPGVVGLPSGGLTGEGTRIRIRGTNTLSQSNEPIVYLNGVRIDNGGGRGPFIGTGGGGQPSRLDDIDPSSIERIEILKGAAAATLYGTEASSGVIQIFTKRGSEGAPRWEMQVEQGMIDYPDVFPANAGFVSSASEAQRVSDFFGIQVQPFQVFERDFISPLFETGYTSAYSGSVNGGGGGVTYFASGRYQFEDGPIGGQDIGALAGDVAKKAQGNVSITLAPADGLQLRINSMYTQSDNSTINNNNNIYAPFTLAMFGQPQRADCTTNRGSSEPTGDGRCTGVGAPLGEVVFATVRETLQRTTDQQAQHFNGSVSASYRPVDEIGLDMTFGIDMVNQQDVQFAPFGYDVDLLTTNNIAGSRLQSDRNFRQLSLDGRLSWETDLRERISSQFVVGSQGFIERVEFGGSFGRDFPGPGFGVTQAGSYQEARETFSSIVNAGFFAQEQLGFNDWIFGTVGGRYDYNSAFGESAGGALYPKASISVIPSSRADWNANLLSTLRVRAAIGQSGLQPGAFDQLTTFGAVRSEFGAGVEPSNLGNPNLKPEVSTEWEFGAETGFLRDRVAIEATYWNRATSDALISRQFPVSGGFLRRQLDNIGELEASGVELGIRGSAVDNDAVTINLFANTAYLQENIASLGGAPPLKVGGSYPRYRNWIREGYAPVPSSARSCSIPSIRSISTVIVSRRAATSCSPTSRVPSLASEPPDRSGCWFRAGIRARAAAAAITSAIISASRRPILPALSAETSTSFATSLSPRCSNTRRATSRFTT